MSGEVSKVTGSNINQTTPLKNIKDNQIYRFNPEAKDTFSKLEPTNQKISILDRFNNFMQPCSLFGMGKIYNFIKPFTKIILPSGTIVNAFGDNIPEISTENRNGKTYDKIKGQDFSVKNAENTIVEGEKITLEGNDKNSDFIINGKDITVYGGEGDTNNYKVTGEQIDVNGADGPEDILTIDNESYKHTTIKEVDKVLLPNGQDFTDIQPSSSKDDYTSSGMHLHPPGTSVGGIPVDRTGYEIGF